MELMSFVFLTDQLNFFQQLSLDLLVKHVHIICLVSVVEVEEHLLLFLDVLVDSEEGWDLLLDDMDEILIWQVLQQNMTSLTSNFGESIKNAAF